LREVTSQNPAVPREPRFWNTPLSELAHGLGVIVGALILYLLTANRWVQGGDNGEFSLLFHTSGVAHPSGYPLYTLYLQAMSWLPSSSPAHGASIATTFLGAGSLLALYWACMRWGVRAYAAAPAVAIFAFSRLPWQSATAAEVFALHALLGALVVALSAPGGSRHGLQRAALLGLVAGLGLSNNHTLVLLAPLGLRGVWTAGAEAGSRLYAFGVALLMFLIGLTPYAALPWLASHGGWAWGDVTTADGLLHHVLRRDFGTFSFGIYGSERTPVLQTTALLKHLIIDSFGIGLALALAGVSALWHRRLPGRDRRYDTIALLLAWLCAGPLLVSLMNLRPTGFSLVVIERFYLLPQLLLVVPAAVAMEWMVMRMRWHARSVWPSTVIVSCICVTLHLEAIHELHRPTAQQYITNTLQQLPDNAVLFSTGDHRTFGYMYAQQALGLRPDVLALDPVLLTYPWYRARIQERLGEPLAGAPVDGGNGFNSLFLMEQLMFRGRAVYLTDLWSDSVRRLPLHQEGALFRITSPNEPPVPVDELYEKTVAIFNGYVLDNDYEATMSTWAALVYEDYARPWFVLGQSFERAGNAAMAARMYEVYERFMPSPIDPLF
jgi:hypothetical protein